MNFIDVSYCKKITDAGLATFSGLTLPLTGIVVSGLSNVSSLGISQLISTCTNTLIDFEAAFLSQETMKSDVFLKLGYCWNLEVIDVCGDKFIDDNAFINILKAEKINPNEEKQKHPGL